MSNAWLYHSTEPAAGGYYEGGIFSTIIIFNNDIYII